MAERQFHRLLVVEAQNRSRLKRDDPDRHRFGEHANHHSVLVAAIDHPEQRLDAAVIDPDRLEPPVEDEANGRQHVVRLVNDTPRGMLRDPSMPHYIIHGLVRYAAEILVDLEQRDVGVSHGRDSRNPA